MTDMLYAGENNPGGSYLIRFAMVAGILLMPAPSTSGPTTAASFKTGFRWFSLYGTEGSKSLDEQAEKTEHGGLWSVTITTWLPSDSATIRQQLGQMIDHQFVLEVEDNAGMIRRVGTPVEHFTLSYGFKTGGAMGDKRGYQLQFKGTLTAPAPILFY